MIIMLNLFESIKSVIRSYWRGFAAMLIFSAVFFVPAILIDADLVLIDCDGEYHGAFVSPESDSESAVSAAFITVGENDYVVKTGSGNGYSVYKIGRAYQIEMDIRGVQSFAETNDQLTVGDLLAKNGVTLGENDIVTPAADTILPVGGSVTVNLVEFVRRTEREPVSFTYQTIYTSLLAEGAERHAEDGRYGLADRTYKDTYVNGVLADSRLVREVRISEPENDITLVGYPNAAGSFLTINSGIIPDGLTLKDGVPSEYTNLISGANCTAYTSNYGSAYGSAGIGLFQGCVAVNPAVIPYGSLLYICNPGGYVYGFAIAGDTGTAMLEGYTDIDCYFETYDESALFGRQYLNVYVIKQLSQSELQAYCSTTESGASLFRSRIPG